MSRSKYATSHLVYLLSPYKTTFEPLFQIRHFKGLVGGGCRNVFTLESQFSPTSGNEICPVPPFCHREKTTFSPSFRVHGNYLIKRIANDARPGVGVLLELSCFLCRRSRARISTQSSSILTGFSWFFSVSPPKSLKLGQDPVRPCPFEFTVHRTYYGSTLYAHSTS